MRVRGGSSPAWTTGSLFVEAAAAFFFAVLIARYSFMRLVFSSNAMWSARFFPAEPLGFFPFFLRNTT